ncbi:MAG: hypothetical protein K2J58_01825 [Muribaculaceae bacterium]|nr:hypothetical protein [Muribaculaceae bacterium]
MKKILKLMSVAFIGVCCASCVEDIKTPDRGPQTNPEKEIAGVYEGTWTINYTEGTTTTTYTIPGTMSLSSDGTAYKGMLTSDAVVEEQPVLEHKLTTAVNVAPLNSAGRYLVYNAVTPNGFDKDILITKLNDKNVIEEAMTTVGSVVTGYALPATNKTEADAFPEGAAYMLTIDFTYNYQCDELSGRRPKKVDYVQKYNFVGYLKK